LACVIRRWRFPSEVIGDNNCPHLLDLVCFGLIPSRLKVEYLRHTVAAEDMVVAANTPGETQVL
jgi:hypothetical protein